MDAVKQVPHDGIWIASHFHFKNNQKATVLGSVFPVISTKKHPVWLAIMILTQDRCREASAASGIACVR